MSARIGSAKRELNMRSRGRFGLDYTGLPGQTGHPVLRSPPRRGVNGLSNPPHHVAIRASALVPQIGEELKKLVVGDDERRNVDPRPPLAVVAWAIGSPPGVR